MFGENVTPECVPYQGGDIPLKNGKIISATEFPVLKNYVGQELIVTDGNTLLGADDKAGVAEIMTAVEYLVSHPEIRHGKSASPSRPTKRSAKGHPCSTSKASAAILPTP